MKKEKVIKVIKEIISYILIIGIVLLVKKYIFTPIRVNGDSMYPTLHDKDIMILNEIGYHLNGLERFDIVVVDIGGEKLIKRVIGLPGDIVEYKDNKLYINGEELEEDFSHAKTKDFSLSTIHEGKIPKGYYFVVGDNRNDSIDSRILGLFHEDDIMGKTGLIVFPFKRIGSVN